MFISMRHSAKILPGIYESVMAELWFDKCCFKIHQHLKALHLFAVAARD